MTREGRPPDPWFLAGFVFVYALCAAYALLH